MYAIRSYYEGPLFLADTTVNSDPAPQTIADTTVLVANEVRRFKIEPRIAIFRITSYNVCYTKLLR